MALSFTNAVRSAHADTITTQVGASGSVRMYDDTPPATAKAALSANNLPVTLPCSATFATAAASGVLTANAITTTNAAATGTASFGRLLKSYGTTAIMQFSVGISATNMILNSTAIQSGGPVSATSFVITEA